MSDNVAITAPNVLAQPPLYTEKTERRLFDRENGEGSYWMPLFLDFLSRVKIVSKELTEPAPIDPYGAQIRFLDEMCAGLDVGVHMFVCLKARQLGISTIMLALDLFWLWMFPGLQGALIADTADNKDTFKQTIEIMLEGLPDGFKIPVKRHNRNGLLLKNGSRLMYMSAGRRKNSGLGRSRGLNFVHACAAPGTPVITENGQIKNIEDVRVGDRVLTHTGEPTVVVDAIGQPNTKGDLIRITPWLGHSLSFTSEHTIPTQRGIIEAKDVRKDDWLVMPVRRIEKLADSIVLPETAARPQGAGSISIGSGAVVPLTEEFGYLCGYFLAEGTINFNSRGGASAISFARHVSERRYFFRAENATKGIATAGKTRTNKGTKTRSEHLYGASLARWMHETFGHAETKRIPDIVFEWGEAFCRGLVAGLLCGDGSKSATVNQGYETPRVILPTIHSSIAMQIRDVVAALGMGWGSCSVKDAGVHYGRNCKTCWRITWSGDAARHLRALMGLKTAPAKRDWIQRYKIQSGLIHIKIRKIETGIKCDTIYDLSVAHDDHTFRTPYFAIGNTECSSWGDQKGLDSLLAALAAENPNRLYVFESTALGYNLFFEMCETAKAKQLEQRFMFIGWWAKEIYRFPVGTPKYAEYWEKNPELSIAENAVQVAVAQQYGHHISTEQWAWYRSQAADKSTASLLEEYPSTESEAFQATGNSFFSTQRVTTDVAFINSNAIMPRPYSVTLGESFTKLLVQESSVGADGAHLHIWEEPNPRGKYVMGVDPATGEAEGDDPDRTVISIWRGYADKMVQVAEYATTDPTSQQCCWVMAYLAACYRDCMLNVEKNGPGLAVMAELKTLRQMIAFGDLQATTVSLGRANALAGLRWFLYHRTDSMGADYIYNFQSNAKTKSEILNSLRDAYDTDRLIPRSVPLLREMSTLTQVGSKIQGSGRNKDDRVFAAALAQKAWSEYLRPSMMAEKRTFASEMVAEQALTAVKTGVDGLSRPVVDHIVKNFFQQQAVQRAEQHRNRLFDINY